jgi:hypothetical protein
LCCTLAPICSIAALVCSLAELCWLAPTSLELGVRQPGLHLQRDRDDEHREAGGREADQEQQLGANAEITRLHSRMDSTVCGDL